MATAFLPLAHCFAPLQALFAWLAPRPAPAANVPARTPARLPARVAARAPLATVGSRRAPQALRVVRVLEPSAPRAVAGRMVISGRLADVCAELDRLAALEARGR
jgi:hypothetical protein